MDDLVGAQDRAHPLVEAFFTLKVFGKKALAQEFKAFWRCIKICAKDFKSRYFIGNDAGATQNSAKGRIFFPGTHCHNEKTRVRLGRILPGLCEAHEAG